VSVCCLFSQRMLLYPPPPVECFLQRVFCPRIVGCFYGFQYVHTRTSYNSMSGLHYAASRGPSTECSLKPLQFKCRKRAKRKKTGRKTKFQIIAKHETRSKGTLPRKKGGTGRGHTYAHIYRYTLGNIIFCVLCCFGSSSTACNFHII